MNVTIDDLKRVGKNYISKLFNGNESNTVIVAHPDKVKDLAESFSKYAVFFFSFLLMRVPWHCFIFITGPRGESSRPSNLWTRRPLRSNNQVTPFAYDTGPNLHNHLIALIFWRSSEYSRFFFFDFDAVFDVSRDSLMPQLFGLRVRSISPPKTSKSKTLDANQRFNVINY